MKVRVYLSRRGYRTENRYGFVESEVDRAWWLCVLGEYRDLRRQGALQSSARALIKFTLEATK